MTARTSSFERRTAIPKPSREALLERIDNLETLLERAEERSREAASTAAECARLRAALVAIAAHHTCPDGIRSLALSAVEERSGAAASTAGEGVKP